MFNKDVLKKITILYVEDEDEIRSSILSVLEKFFKEIFTAEDGQKGLKKYKQLKDDNISVDIVISDISMPNMNGIEMLKEIKKIDNSLLCILTTAHAETQYFLDAIKLGVTHYVLKPLIAKDLLLKIQDLATLKYQELVIKNKQKEAERYINIINKVAIVTKTDLGANITYANDLFCEVTGYSQEELIGTNQRIVRHQDMSKPFFDVLWNTLRAKKIWIGKIKSKAKDGSPYIVNAHIFPIFDETGESVIEYMAVRFLITEEEAQKREFQKKVINNIQDQRKKENDLKCRIDELENKLRFSDTKSISIIRDSLEIAKKKEAKAKNQLIHYEKEITFEKDRHSRALSNIKTKMEDLRKENTNFRDSSKKYKKKTEALQSEVSNQSVEIVRLNKMLEEQAKTIKDLKEVIKQREEQLKGK